MTWRSRHQSPAGVISPRARPGPAPQGGRRRGLARLLAGASMVTLTAMLFWLVTDEGFRVSEERITISGVARADETELRATLGDISRSPNVFRVRASQLVEGLHALPQVRSAQARVTLPADVRIEVTEREPLFVWTNGNQAWLVDETGLFFAEARIQDRGASDLAEVAGAADADVAETAAADGPPGPGSSPGARTPPAAEPAPGTAATRPPVDPLAGDLPSVEDDRLVSALPRAGSQLPDSELAVMRQLLAVTPEMLGSEASSLRVRIDDRHGYEIRSEGLGWIAVFGHYSPTLQPPDVVPRQVQCLQWALGRWERRLSIARLALSEETCGTVQLRGGGG